MLSPELLAKLACPACRKRLALAPDGKSLKCAGCRRVYPIRNGVVILLKEEGKVEAE
jgi:LSD1 subclass zinc finger protein